MEAVFLGVVGLVLFAILVGALLPVLFQLKRTLAHAEKQMKRLGDRADRLLGDVDETVRRVNAMSGDVALLVKRAELASEGLEEMGPVAARLAGNVGAITDTLELVRMRLNGASAVGMSLIPAVMAAIQAWRGAATDGQRPEAPPPDLPEPGIGPTGPAPGHPPGVGPGMA